VIRGDGDALDLLPGAKSVLAEMDPLIPIAEMRTLRDVWGESMAREQFVLTLLGIFGGVALLLATVGVYGVTSQAHTGAHEKSELEWRLAPTLRTYSA
jgi:hypothetical protein